MSSAERIVLAVSILCLIAGGGLRVAAANDYLWLDELHTGWTVSGDLSEVFWRSAEGNQSPLFFYLCFAVVKMLGYSAIALRAISLAGGMLLLIGVPLVVYRMTHCAAAVLLVSLFLMLDYDCVFYASEARPYGMLQWLGGLQAVSFWCWSRRLFGGDKAVESSLQFRRLACWPMVSLLSAAVVSTHVTGAWLLLAEAVFVVLASLVQRKWPTTEMWKCTALFFALSLPALLALLTAWQRRGNWTSVSNVDLVLADFLWTFGAMIGLPAAILAMDRWICLSNKRVCEVPWALLAFIGLWALVPTLSIVLLDYFQAAPLALARYALVGVIAFPLFTAFALARMNSKMLRWATLSIVVGLLIWNSAHWLRLALPPMTDLRNENWADAVATIAQGRPGYPVLLAGNVLEDVEAGHNRASRFEAYLKFPVLGADPDLENPIFPLNTQGELFTSTESAVVEKAGGGWLIVRDVPENIPQIMEQIQQNPQASEWQFDLARFKSPMPNYLLLFRITSK